MSILLEKITVESDFAFVSQLVFDPEVMEMNMGRAFTQEEAEAYFGYMLAYNSEHLATGCFKVYAEDSGTYIGICSLLCQEERAEVEYMLLPAYWNQGYATAILGELLNIARQCGVRHISGIVDPDNIPSQRVLMKNDFVFESMMENEDDHSAAAVYGITL